MESLQTKKTYPTNSRRYSEITQKLAIFVGSSSASYNIVENLEFRSLLYTLDPRYATPRRASIVKEVATVLIDLKAKVSTYIEQAVKISITADVWSKKGLTSSYLGITAHFFSHKDRRRHVATLAMRRMTEAHTGRYIREVVDNVLSEWDIHPSKVMASLTDNGSNMVAAFRDSKRVEDSDDGIESNDVESDEDFEEPSEDGTGEFVLKEIDQESSFHSLNRVGCYAHTLQLVVNKFNQVETFKETVSHAHSIVRKVNSSTKATEMLVKLCRKKLTKDCPTRWSSMFLMINRLLEVRVSLTRVLEELEWDNLVASEWKLLESIAQLLKPFAVATTLVEGEDLTTASCVVPSIVDMTLHLEESKKQKEVSNAATILLSEMKRRFRHFTDPSDPNYICLFVVATAFDPQYRLALCGPQIESAKQEIYKFLKRRAQVESCSSASQSEADASPPHEEEGEPPAKRFHHLSRLLEAKRKEGIKMTSSLPPGKAETERYFQSFQTELSVPTGDPLKYWIDQEKNYPLLAPLAFDVLCVPATSAPAERVFSAAGDSSAGKRNRLSDKNLENEVLLKKNKHYL